MEANVKVLISSLFTSHFRAGVKGMLVLLPLLGLTWVFGIMAINKDVIVFQYLFAILNSLQVRKFTMIFYILFNIVFCSLLQHSGRRLKVKIVSRLCKEYVNTVSTEKIALQLININKTNCVNDWRMLRKVMPIASISSLYF